MTTTWVKPRPDDVWVDIQEEWQNWSQAVNMWLPLPSFIRSTSITGIIIIINILGHTAANISAAGHPWYDRLRRPLRSGELQVIVGFRVPNSEFDYGEIWNGVPLDDMNMTSRPLTKEELHRCGRKKDVGQKCWWCGNV